MDDSGNPIPSPLLTIADAATLLYVSKATIRRWTNQGRLKCSRIGVRNERRFRRGDLLDFIKSPEMAKPQAAQHGEHLANPAPTQLSSPAHCCIISNDIEEEWTTLGPEVLNNLEQGAQVVVIEDSYRRACLEKLLVANGLDKQALLASHSLRCVSIEDSYFLSGIMQWDRAVAFVESTILAAKASGFDRVLVIGAGSWADNDDGVVEELKKYELGLDEMLSRYPGASVLCPYAATQVTSQMMVQAFATHPAMRIQSKTIQGLL